MLREAVDRDASCSSKDGSDKSWVDWSSGLFKDFEHCPLPVNYLEKKTDVCDRHDYAAHSKRACRPWLKGQVNVW